jgi:hypothetical protein
MVISTSDTAGKRVGGLFRRAEALGYAYEGHLRGRTSPRRRASSGGARDFSRRAGGAPEFASKITSTPMASDPNVLSLKTSRCR